MNRSRRISRNLTYFCSVCTTSCRIATRFSLSFEMVAGRPSSSSSGRGFVASPFLLLVLSFWFFSEELTDSFEEERYGSAEGTDGFMLSSTDSGFGSLAHCFPRGRRFGPLGRGGRDETEGFDRGSVKKTAPADFERDSPSSAIFTRINADSNNASITNLIWP